MQSSYYSAPIPQFLESADDAILGELTRRHHHALEHEQRGAWLSQIAVLKDQLGNDPTGHLYIEFSIPRMGKRADAVDIRGGTVFVIEFKVGSETFDRNAIDQVDDYALDLKNFHLGSHALPIVPVLIATRARQETSELLWAADMVAKPVLIEPRGLASVLATVAPSEAPAGAIDPIAWQASGYRPTCLTTDTERHTTGLGFNHTERVGAQFPARHASQVRQLWAKYAVK